MGYAAAPTSPNPAPPVATASPQTALVPAPSVGMETATEGVPWLWLLLIPLLAGLGGLLWWLLKSRGSEAAIGAVAHTGAVSIPAGTVTAPAAPVALNGHGPQNLKLYEERLVADKTRQKTGDVAVSKRVETELAQVSVPIEKERVVIERTTPTDAGTTVAPGDADFRDGEVARMDVYEETPDIHKEASLREEVEVKKVVEQETVEAQETIRREELDVDTEYRTVEDSKNGLPNNRI